MTAKVALVKVNMGSPILTANQIPIVSDKEQVINEPLDVDGTTYRFTAVSMGNPHVIVYMDDLENLEIEKIGPKFENHIAFPDRINTEFVRVIDRHTLQMRVGARFRRNPRLRHRCLRRSRSLHSERTRR